MTTLINIHALDDTVVGTIKFQQHIDQSPWKPLLTEPFYAVNVTALPTIPGPNDVWDGTKFESLTGMPNSFENGVQVFAFVVNGRTQVIHPLDIEGGHSIIAAYMTGVRFELVSDE
jgi:hypothetical protein